MAEEGRSLAGSIVGVFGSALYLVVGWLYLGTPLVVPYPWVYGFWALWLAGIYLLVKVLRSRPMWTPLVAVVAVGVWVGLVQLGAWLFGWTA